MKQFFIKHKVFILGLLGAILLAGQQFTGTTPLDYKGLIFAVILAILSYLAKNLRGQVATIIGIIFSVFLQFTEMYGAGTVHWEQLILQLAILIGGVFAPPAKPLEYEQKKSEEPGIEQRARV